MAANPIGRKSAKNGYQFSKEQPCKVPSMQQGVLPVKFFRKPIRHLACACCNDLLRPQ